jgi:cyclomaltodextrinase
LIPPTSLACFQHIATKLTLTMCGGVFVAEFRIDRRLGDDMDVDRFIQDAHQRGLRALLDGVFNRVSRRFDRFVDVTSSRGKGPNAGWFRLTGDDREPEGFRAGCFEGHRELVSLNRANPAVLDWAVAVATRWLERGCDGWRLDAAYAVAPEFWRGFTDRVRARFPDALLFGEMIHGDYAGFVTRTGFDSVTQYELHKAIWSSLNDANFFELSWSLERHRALVDSFVPMTFVGNHDVTRLLSVLEDPTHAGHALAVLFTVPGSPLVYYGDEVGARGIKEHRAGGDDAVRPAFATLPSPEAGGEASGLFALHQHLIAFRRERPWLTDGVLSFEHLANESIGYVVRERFGTAEVAVTLNLGKVPIVSIRPGWPAAAGEGRGEAPTSISPGSWSVQEHDR